MFNMISSWFSRNSVSTEAVQVPVTKPKADKDITSKANLEKKIADAQKHIQRLTQLRDSKVGGSRKCSTRASLSVQVNAHQERLNELLKMNKILVD